MNTDETKKLSQEDIDDLMLRLEKLTSFPYTKFVEKEFDIAILTIQYACVFFLKLNGKIYPWRINL